MTAWKLSPVMLPVEVVTALFAVRVWPLKVPIVMSFWP